MNPLPPVIASSRPVFGQSLIDKRTDLQLLESFASQAAIEKWLVDLAGRDIDTVATLSDPRIFAGVKAVRAKRGVSVNLIPIIPNVMGLVREATEYGMMGAGFRLLGRLGLINVAWIGIRSAPKALRVLKRDFNTMLSILWDIEMGQFRGFRPQRVLLHPQIADLALAVGNRRLFEEFAATMRRYGAEPGVVTHNFGTMAERLAEWGIDISLFQTPVNGEGWHMKPNREACEALLKDGRIKVIADRPGLAPPPTSKEIETSAAWPAVESVLIDDVCRATG